MAKQSRLGDAGMTVIELSLACVLLAGLATVAIMWLGGHATRVHNAACRSDVRAVALAQEQYYDQTGTYPASTRELKSAGLLQSEPPAGEVTMGRTPEESGGMFAVGSTHSTCSDFRA